MAEDLDGVAERPPGPAYHTLAALPSPARLGPWDASHSPRTPKGTPRRYAGLARKNKTRKDCRQRSLGTESAWHRMSSAMKSRFSSKRSSRLWRKRALVGLPASDQ